MAFIDQPGADAVTTALGLIQACVDQLQGQEVFAEFNVGGTYESYMAKARTVTLGVLQAQLNVVYVTTGLRSPVAEADGSESLLRTLRP